MGTYRFAADVGLGPTDALWLWLDLDRLAEWMTGVTRVTDVMESPGRTEFTLPGHTLPLVISPGARYTIWFGRHPVRIEVLPLVDPRMAGYRTHLEGTFRRGESLVTFEPLSGGSRLTLEVRTEGRLPGLVSRLLATGAHRGSYRGQLRSFARLAERERMARLII